MSSKRELSPLEKQAVDALRRARRLPWASPKRFPATRQGAPNVAPSRHGCRSETKCLVCREARPRGTAWQVIVSTRNTDNGCQIRRSRMYAAASRAPAFMPGFSFGFHGWAAQPYREPTGRYRLKFGKRNHTWRRSRIAASGWSLSYSPRSSTAPGRPKSKCGIRSSEACGRICEL